MKNQTKAPAANKTTKVTPVTTKATKAAPVEIKLSANFNKVIKAAIVTHNKSIVAAETSDIKSVQIINIVLTEIITLKKVVIAPANAVNANEYKLREIKKAMKESNNNAYFNNVLDIAFKYIHSGYSVNLNDISFSTIKKLLDILPAKAAVKGKKESDLKIILDKAAADKKAAHKVAAKKALKSDTTTFINNLDSEEFAHLKAYFLA